MAEGSNEQFRQERQQRGMAITLEDLLARHRSRGYGAIVCFVIYTPVTLLLIYRFWIISRAIDHAESVSPNLFSALSKAAATRSVAEAVVIAILHVAITLWISKRLFDSRQQGYAMLRAIRRAQNYFLLNDADVRPYTVEEWKSYLPIGFGSTRAIQSVDNTGVWRSYFRRHVWLVGMNIALVYLLFQCTDSEPVLLPLVVLIVIHFIAMVLWVNRDRTAMTRGLMEERDLPGSDPDDYPEATQPATP